MDDTDLKKIESKVWTSYFKDGLWDIFFGLMLLTMGLRTLTDNVLFTFGMLAAVLVHILGKRWITVPRLGVVRFSETRRKKRSFLIYLIGGHGGCVHVLECTVDPERRWAAYLEMHVGCTPAYHFRQHCMHIERRHVSTPVLSQDSS